MLATLDFIQRLPPSTYLSNWVTPSGRWWHDIWRVRWSLTRYWRSLRLWRCVLWISGWLWTNREQIRWIDDWIIQWRRHSYHWWWQFISLWVTVLVIKASVITRIRLFHTLIVPCSTFFGDYQDPLDVALWLRYEFVVVFYDCYFCCWWTAKGKSQLFGAATPFVFDF